MDRIENLGVKYKLLKGLRSRNPISLPKTTESLREIIKENSIDIIHTHHRLSEFYALQAANTLTDKRPVTIITSLSIVRRKYNIEFRSDSIIAVSYSVRNMLLHKFNVDKDKITHIPNFADTEELTEKDALYNAEKTHNRIFTILAVGRFHLEKNFEVLLKALKTLNDPDIRLMLIGEGNREMNYRKYISQHELNVEIIAPQKELGRFFQIADICVLPSARDPFPNFMLQAGLHGKPFIGANVDGIGELINSGVNGLLFESGNEHELAEKIRIFKGNKKLAGECAENLQVNVNNNYTQMQVIPLIERLYMQLSRSKN